MNNTGMNRNPYLKFGNLEPRDSYKLYSFIRKACMSMYVYV